MTDWSTNKRLEFLCYKLALGLVVVAMVVSDFSGLLLGYLSLGVYRTAMHFQMHRVKDGEFDHLFEEIS